MQEAFRIELWNNSWSHLGNEVRSEQSVLDDSVCHINWDKIWKSLNLIDNGLSVRHLVQLTSLKSQYEPVTWLILLDFLCLEKKNVPRGGAHAFNPSTWEAGAGRGQHGLQELVLGQAPKLQWNPDSTTHPPKKRKGRRRRKRRIGRRRRRKRKQWVYFADFVTMLFYSMNQQPWKEWSMKSLLKYSVCLRVQITVLFSSNCLSVPMLKTILNLSSVNFKLISVGF